jgi:glutathione peroxidase
MSDGLRLAIVPQGLDVSRIRMSSSTPTASNVYEFTADRLDGTPASLSEYSGRVLLIVNVASQCGFTPQYAGLEALYRKHQAAGLTVLGFPCNQFGAQEPGSPEEIRNFCSTKYDVSFPLFAKVDVNGENAHPLYRWLKSQAKGLLGTESIKWNFTKFLLDRRGNVADRFAPATTAEQLESAVVELLNRTA